MARTFSSGTERKAFRPRITHSRLLRKFFGARSPIVLIRARNFTRSALIVSLDPKGGNLQALLAARLLGTT